MKKTVRKRAARSELSEQRVHRVTREIEAFLHRKNDPDVNLRYLITLEYVFAWLDIFTGKPQERPVNVDETIWRMLRMPQSN